MPPRARSRRRRRSTAAATRSSRCSRTRTREDSSARSWTGSRPATGPRSPSCARIPAAPARFAATRSCTSATARSSAGTASRPGTSRPMRDLRLLAGATAISAAGDLVLVVVLSLRVHDLTGSGFAVAALFAALMGPIALLAPVAGRIVDRVETRRVLLWVSLAQALVAMGLVFANGLVWILALSALLGAGAAVAGPAEAALVPIAASDDQLRRANGWVESARYIGFT